MSRCSFSSFHPVVDVGDDVEVDDDDIASNCKHTGPHVTFFQGQLTSNPDLFVCIFSGVECVVQ